MRRVVIGWVVAAAAAFACWGVCATSASAFTWSLGSASAIPSGGLSPNFLVVSCVDAGDCTAISAQDEATDTSVPTVDQEVDGDWQTPEVLSGFSSYLGAGDYVNFDGLDCVDAEDCIAVGDIAPSSGSRISFSLSEEGGPWGDPDVIGQGLGTSFINADSGAGSAVSCSSASDCVVVGSTENAAGTTFYALAAFGTISGFDGISEDVPDEAFSSVSCVPGGTTCTAAGTSFSDGAVEAIAQSETDGDWSEPNDADVRVRGWCPWVGGLLDLVPDRRWLHRRRAGAKRRVSRPGRSVRGAAGRLLW